MRQKVTMLNVVWRILLTRYNNVTKIIMMMIFAYEYVIYTVYKEMRSLRWSNRFSWLHIMVSQWSNTCLVSKYLQKTKNTLLIYQKLLINYKFPVYLAQVTSKIPRELFRRIKIWKNRKKRDRNMKEPAENMLKRQDERDKRGGGRQLSFALTERKR